MYHTKEDARGNIVVYNSHGKEITWLRQVYDKESFRAILDIINDMNKEKSE